MPSSSSTSDAASNIFSSGRGLAINNTGSNAANLALLYNFANVNTIKLSPENYLLWRAQVLPMLKSHLLLGYVNDLLPCPDQLITNPRAGDAGAPAESRTLRTRRGCSRTRQSCLSSSPTPLKVSSGC
jgi:hypothetical protein